MKVLIKCIVLFSIVITGGFYLSFEKPIPKTLFFIGDSTVKNGQGNGSNGQWGWASFIGDYFDSNKVVIENKALGGTSTRTFYNNPKLWQTVLDQVKTGDYVVIQFGHNDSSPIVDSTRSRGTIKGNGDAYQEVYNPLLKYNEMVYSYGYYLRLFVKNIRDKGAIAIICSPIPRNAWNEDKVRKSDYATWAKEAALQSGAFFIPLQDLVITEYEKSGKDLVNSQYFESKDATHTIKAGAELNAKLVARYMAANKKIGLATYLK